MNQVLQIVYLARHGETAWTLSGQHTGLTDLPLTERGERNARRLEERLRGLSFAKVFTSPLQRASASWLALELSLKSTRIWSNGTMVSMRGTALPKSGRSAPIGNCSATAVQEGNRQPKPRHRPTAW